MEKRTKGICKIIGDGDWLGELTPFRDISTSLVHNSIMLENNWFSFCTKISKEQVDIMSIKNDTGVSLGHMLSEYYPDMEYRPAVYKNLLRDYLCYYESPSVAKDRNNGGWKNSFNKYLVTSNIGVIAKWLGISEEEADMQYGAKFRFFDEDSDTNLIPYYKLYTSKEGVNKITKVRSDLDVSESGVRIIPLYALKAGIDALYEKLKDTTYNISFIKDGGQKRVINTTFNEDLIKELYGCDDKQVETFVQEGISCWYGGSFEDNPNMPRGYIRVFEVGGSIYDTPTRSINYARITGIEEAKPDLSYIKIDLSSVIDSFNYYIKKNPEINKNIEEVVELLEVFDVGSSRKLNDIAITSVQSLSLWADSQYVLLSTPFLRELALFMIGNPTWFEGYTGLPNISNGNSSLGGETADWDDFGLDIG